MTRPIPLGAFLVEAPLGEGGMASVWHGVHARTRVPAALKVMGGSFPKDLDARAFFREEVHAVAGLDHPGIVMVLDQGEVDTQAEEASEGALRAGSPYLAMELATSTLRASPGVRGWPDLQEVLLSILAALAHAHSRGVVHRDVKSSNVLVFELAGQARTLKLADFGLAFALDRQGLWADPDLVSGTPWTMAPEQLVGAWRDYGPWTDLYGLGCLGYELASGRPAFAGSGRGALAEEREHIPRLRPAMPVPAGFEGWLGRLLQPDPRARFQRAADAAWALQALRGPRAPAISPLPALLDAPTAPLLHVEEKTTAGDPRPPVVHRGAVPPGPLEPPAPRPLPPLPADWRTPTAPASVGRDGAGLGLFGLRPIAMVGRSAERDALWEALRTVVTERSPCIVLLCGAPGLGKTRLAEWLGERAHEVGAANVLKAFHGSLGGPGDGLPRMVSRFLRCIELEPAELLARAESLVRAQGSDDPFEWQALTALMGPASCPAWPGDAPQSAAAERHALVRRLLRRLSRKRPVVVLLDDVQWGADALRFAQSIFDEREPDPIPVLLLLTVNDEALGDRYVEAGLLEGLFPWTTRIEVAPLPGDEQAALIQRVLYLQPELVTVVQERTGGNPLFAVHLLDHWVHRGALVPSDHGFALRPGEAVPHDVQEVWRERLDAIVAEAGAEAASALELAAALGQWVNQREWEQACARAGLSEAAHVVDALVAQRLARRVQGGWTFGHGLLRDDLERISRASGRWSWLNRVCAESLEARALTGERGVAERVGGHWRAAGEPAAAVAPLLRGAREHRETSEYRLAHTLLETRDQALRLAGVEAADPQWGEGWVLRSRLALHEGDLDTAFRWAALAEREGGRQGWLATRAEALRLLGDAHRRRGELRAAHQLYTRCVGLRPEREARHGMAAGLWGLGDLARQQGRTAEAAALFERSGALYEEIGDRHGIADRWIGLADVAYQERDLEGAATRYALAREIFEELGNRYGVARAINGKGEVARARGDLDAAAEAYQSSLSQLVLVSSAEAMFPRLNLGLLALLRGEHAQAMASLRASAAEAERLGWRAVHAFAETALLPGHARAADWAAWDVAFDSIEAVLMAAIVEPDVAWAARLAGECAAEAGELTRAQRAWRLALAQYEALADHEAVRAAHAALAHLG